MKDFSNVIETQLGEWYSKVPHLPKDARKWLTDNIWWLALIGVVISVLGLLAVIPMLLIVMGLATAAVGVMPTGLGGYYGAVTTIGWLGTFLTLVQYVFSTLLLALAVAPLKDRARRGWLLLFWSYLANFAFTVLGALVVLNFSSIVMTVISAAIGAYFLFEIRDHFSVKSHGKHKK